MKNTKIVCFYFLKWLIKLIYFLLGLKHFVDIAKYKHSKLQSKFEKLQMEHKKHFDTNVNLKGKIDVMEKHFRMKLVNLVYVVN